MSKRKFKEPVTTRKTMLFLKKSRRFVDRLNSDGEYTIGPVRIMREKDYQRLLRAAKRGSHE